MEKLNKHCKQKADKNYSDTTTKNKIQLQQNYDSYAETSKV